MNNTSISKYDLLKLFNHTFREDHMAAIVPDDSVKVNKSLVNTRTDFTFEVPSYEHMIVEMKDWVQQHQDLYPHYFGGKTH